MIGFVKAYPYLFANICTTTFLIVVGWFALTRKQWKATMLSGLANAPCFVFLVLLEDEYWNPVRFGGLALGIGDVLCSFAVAGMAWFVVGLFFGDRISFELRWKKILIRYVVLANISAVVFIILYFFKVSGMTSLVLTCLIVAIILFIIKRLLWRIVLVGLVGFPLFYLCVVKVYFLVWPDFVLQWNLTTSWGKVVLGIPLGEIIWSVVFGVYWPLFVVYIADGKLLRSESL